MTRPDIGYAVNKVAQFMHSPTEQHWTAVKRILRYVKFTISVGLFFQPSSTISLTVYSDADWAGCPDDRKSTTGYGVFLGSHLVSWCSRKQKTVA